MPEEHSSSADSVTTLDSQAETARELLERIAPNAVIGDLTATVAHEINNPIFGILNFLELAKEELAQDHPVQGYLNEALEQTERISKLIRDLMSVARADTGVKEAFDPVEAVKSAVALYQKRLLKQHIDPRQNFGDYAYKVFGIRGGLMLAVIDLLDNARRSMEPLGKGQVIIEGARSEKGWFQLKIEDHGIGLPEGEPSELFDSQASSWNPPGVGLGLHRARNWVEGMKGKLRLEKCPDHSGTIAYIHLPPMVKMKHGVI
jgi:two-component system NtrC family sensor kinase